MNMTYKLTSMQNVRDVTITLAAAVILPILIHLIPTPNGVPAGAVYLPIFIAPLVAILLKAPFAAIVTAIFAPALNHILTGNPAAPILVILTAELVVFTVIALVIHQRYPSFMFLAIPAYAAAKVATLIVMVTLKPLPAPPMTYVGNSIVNAIPGIIILLILPFAVKRFLQR